MFGMKTFVKAALQKTSYRIPRSTQIQYGADFVIMPGQFLNSLTRLGFSICVNSLSDMMSYCHFRPVSATFLIVCLKAQMMESRISLNWAGAMDRKAGKHWEVAA